jgi:hypothetical protein
MLPKLNQEYINPLNRSIISNEIKAVIESPNKEQPRLNRFTAEFYQLFKEKLTPILFKLFHKIERERMLSNSFFETSITLIPKPAKDTKKKKERKS